MLHRLTAIARAIRRTVARKLRPAGEAAPDATFSAEATLSRLATARRTLIFIGSAGLAGWLLYAHAP